MKTMLRTIALLLIIGVTMGLLGCELGKLQAGFEDKEQDREDSQQIERIPETTETVEQTEDTTTLPPETEPVENTEAAATLPPETEPETLGKPGSKKLPAVELFQLTYGQIKTLEWEETEVSDLENGTWMLRTETEDETGYCFVFPGDLEDTNARPKILTVDDLNYTSKAYITAKIRLGMAARELPEAIQDKIGPMDGGMFAATSLNGIEADMLFDEPMEDVGDAILYCVQLRRGA